MRSGIIILILSFILISIPGISAEYTQWMTEEFVNNASMRSNGWTDGTFVWTGHGNVTSDGWFYGISDSTAMYNGNLDRNWSKSYDFYIATEQRIRIATSLQYDAIGFTNCLNCSLALRDFVISSLSESSHPNLVHRTYADGTYCSVNDSAYKTDGSLIYNRSIRYNISYDIINTTHGIISVYSNLTTPGYNYSVSFNCKNLSNMTFFFFAREPGSQLDYIRLYVNLTDSEPNITSVIVNSPINNSVIHSPLIVSSYYTGNQFTPSANCSLFVNGSLYNVSDTFLNNTAQNLSIALSDGDYSFSMNCRNGVSEKNSSIYSIHIDNTIPGIYLSSPLNHSVADKILNLTGYAVNTNLDILNLTIEDVFDSVYYSVYMSNISSSTQSFTNETINTTAYPDGIYFIRITATDSANNSAYLLSDFNITSCVPDWICIGFEPCRINDSTYCDEVDDLNICGDAYPGNISADFGEFECNYCSMNVYNLSTGSVCYFGILNYSVRDANFSSCCLVTDLASDCIWNGYDLRLTDGNYTIFENCEMPIQEIYLGFDVMLVLMILVGLALLFIGLAYSMHILVLASGLLNVIIGGVAVDTAWIKIFLIIIGFVELMIFAMLEYDNWR